MPEQRLSRRSMLRLAAVLPLVPFTTACGELIPRWRSGEDEKTRDEPRIDTYWAKFETVSGRKKAGEVVIGEIYLGDVLVAHQPSFGSTGDSWSVGRQPASSHKLSGREGWFGMIRSELAARVYLSDRKDLQMTITKTGTTDWTFKVTLLVVLSDGTEGEWLKDSGPHTISTTDGDVQIKIPPA